MQERDKFLTEKVLQQCWHESSGMSWLCGKCKTDVGWRGSALNSIAVEKLNPNFSTPEGFFRLWNFCKEQPWWRDFISKNYYTKSSWGKLEESDFPGVIALDLINPDVFADAIARYHKWEGE